MSLRNTIPFLAFGACADPGAQLVVPRAAPTAPILRWTTPSATRGRVEYEVDDGEIQSTPSEAEATTDHSVRVLGLPAGARVRFTGLTDDGLSTDVIYAEMADFPPEWPSLTVTGTPSWQGYLMIPLVGSFGGVVIFDAQSRPVWWWAFGDPDAQSVRTLPSMDGRGVYVSEGSKSASGGYTLRKLSWSGVQVARSPVRGLTHDFVELEPDVFVGLDTQRVTDANGETCNAESVLRFDLDGALDTVWDAGAEAVASGAACAKSESERSLTHLNAIDHDAAAGTLLVGSRSFSTIYEVDVGSGEVIGSIGEMGTIRIDDEASAFEGQHQFQRLDDGNWLVFDDGAAERGYSRAIEYSVAGDVATETWSYDAGQALQVYVLGDVQRLPNGNTLVDWSTAGRLQEVDPTGATTWQMDVGLGTAFGYIWLTDSLYSN